MNKAGDYEYLKHCPLCDSGEGFSLLFGCRDFLVSGESFSVTRCKSCGFVLTNPRPYARNTRQYYQSENYISHTDSDKGLMAKVYQLVRKKMLKTKLNKLKSLPIKSKNLLDVGCGTGAFLEAARSNGFQVKGFEPGEAPGKIAAEKGLEVMSREEELLKLEAGSFQLITLWHVLEHVPDFLPKMKLFHRLLSDEGFLVLALPMHQSFDAGFYKNQWAAWDAPRHLYHFDEKSLNLSAQKTGFQVHEKFGLPFDSYYVSILSEGYKENLFGKFRALAIGTWSNLMAVSGKKPWSSEVFILKKA